MCPFIPRTKRTCNKDNCYGQQSHNMWWWVSFPCSRDLLKGIIFIRIFQTLVTWLYSLEFSKHLWCGRAWLASWEKALEDLDYSFMHLILCHFEYQPPDHAGVFHLSCICHMIAIGLQFAEHLNKPPPSSLKTCPDYIGSHYMSFVSRIKSTLSK